MGAPLTRELMPVGRAARCAICAASEKKTRQLVYLKEEKHCSAARAAELQDGGVQHTQRHISAAVAAAGPASKWLPIQRMDEKPPEA
ncbi:unnamed protein product [Urochloa humidicola]